MKVKVDSVTLLLIVLALGMTTPVSGEPLPGESLGLRTVIEIGSDLGYANSLYNPRSFNGKNYIAQINSGKKGLGCYPVDSPLYEALARIVDEPGTRMAAPFPTADYILAAGDYGNDLFSRFDPNLSLDSRIFATNLDVRPSSFDWVDENTIIHNSYASGLRTNLYLTNVNAEPFQVTANTAWNTNGYVTTPATTRIRNVRVGDIYSDYAYYGDAGTVTAGFWAINLADGTSTQLGTLDITGSGSWGLWTVKELDGYLYVQTTDDGIYIYNMINATTLGTLHTKYTKNMLDAIANDTNQNWGFDVTAQGQRMLITAGRDGRAIEFGLPRVDAGTNQTVMWPDAEITLQLDATILWHIGEPNPQDLVMTWSQLDGPATVIFDPCNTEDTSVTFDTPGFYKLNLCVALDEDIVNDEVLIRIKTEADGVLIAHWALEEGSEQTIADSSSNNNLGILAGNPEPNWVSGWIKTPPATTNSALEFYGIGQQVARSYVKITTDLTSDPNLDNLQNDITLSAWIKIGDGFANTEDPYIVAAGDSGWRLNAITDSGSVLFTPGSTIAGDGPTSTSSLNDGYWHHVVGMYDYVNSKSSLYIDGVLDVTMHNSGMLVSNDLPVVIGACSTSAVTVERSWNGMIDDVRIYSYAIPHTKAQGGSDSVEGLYEMGLPLCLENILDGDLNEDCYIDMLDLGLLSENWIDSYNMDDFTKLAVDWLRCNHPLDPACN